MPVSTLNRASPCCALCIVHCALCNAGKCIELGQTLFKHRQFESMMDIHVAFCAHTVGEYTLRPDEAKLPSGEQAWQRLVWSGIVVGPDQHGVIRISSPLLLRALIIVVTDSGRLPHLPVFPSQLSSRQG